MGDWGPRNFDNDKSADHLGLLTDRLIQEINEAMSHPEKLEPDDYWGCVVPSNVEILNLFRSKHWVGATVPKPSVVEHWKATYMDVWETHIDNLRPKGDYKTRRREVLIKTFDELLGYAIQQDEYIKRRKGV